VIQKANSINKLYCQKPANKSKFSVEEA